MSRTTISELFSRNREWARQVHESDPDFFKTLASQQSP